MTDEQITDKINAVKEKIQTHAIMVILITAVIVSVVFGLLFTRGSSVDPTLKKQIDSLQKEFKVIVKERQQDSLHSVKLQNDVDSLATDRVKLVAEIRTMSSRITTISNEYEKIPDYLNLSGDSLRREFTRRFNR